MEETGKKAFVMFNNCHGGFAVRNVLRLKDTVTCRD
jgi:uncharacterized protein YecE (DUF72 family)